MKERGMKPARPWNERPIILSSVSIHSYTCSCAKMSTDNISPPLYVMYNSELSTLNTESNLNIPCIQQTSAIFEPYVPPEGDGKLSKFSAGGAKQTYEFLEKKSKSMMAIRKIRSFEEDFSPKDFAETAQDIYIRTHEALMNNDESAIRENVTERLYPEVKFNTENVTIRWKFLGSIEPPRVVHARQTHLVAKENIFAQITVRMHTQQSLAIYDRFGRIMHGSEILAKDVLEYVVFEKNISNLYGEWRMHDKIIPPWAEPKQPSPSTYRVIEREEEDEPEESTSNTEIQEQAIEAVQIKDENSQTKPPPVATA